MNEGQDDQEFARQVQALEVMVKQYLAREALERYGNIKLAYPEKAIQILAMLGQLIRTGKIRQPITDEQLKQMLTQMAPEKKEFKFRRI